MLQALLDLRPLHVSLDDLGVRDEECTGMEGIVSLTIIKTSDGVFVIGQSCNLSSAGDHVNVNHETGQIGIFSVSVVSKSGHLMDSSFATPKNSSRPITPTTPFRNLIFRILGVGKLVLNPAFGNS